MREHNKKEYNYYKNTFELFSEVCKAIFYFMERDLFGLSVTIHFDGR